MSAHTPGPWHVNPRYPFWVEDSEGRRVVDCEGGRLSPDENLANARMIAAAPDLLAACEAILTDREYLTSRTEAQVRAAIDNARGAP